MPTHPTRAAYSAGLRRPSVSSPVGRRARDKTLPTASNQRRGSKFITVLFKWVLQILLMIVAYIGATLALGWNLLQYRVTRRWFFGRPTCKPAPSLVGLPREACFSVMARENTRFYTGDLTCLVSLAKMVRLISIEPATSFRDPLVCTTTTVGLSPHLEYVVLSYAWGDWDHQSTTISLDGKPGFHITRNASIAMRRIRACGEKQPLWIDAVSIDQLNLKEKAQQIGYMRYIYQGAKLAYVYLGGCAGAHANEQNIPNDEIVQCCLQTGASLESTNEPWLDEPKLNSLKWWRRVWTVQEAVMPPDIKVLLGPHQLQWEDLYHAATRTGPFPPEIALPIRDVNDLRTSWHEAQLHQNGLPLSQLLERTSIRDATQEHDRIFSLLAIKSPVSMSSTRLLADYTLSVDSLNRLTTEFILSNERNLDIYTRISWPRSSTLSWATQFTQPLTLNCERPFDAARELLNGQNPAAWTERMCNPTFAEDRLILKGYRFDQIAAVHAADGPLRLDETTQGKIDRLAREFYASARAQVRTLRNDSPIPVAKFFSSQEAVVRGDWNTGLRARLARGATEKFYKRFVPHQTGQTMQRMRGWLRQMWGSGSEGGEQTSPPTMSSNKDTASVSSLSLDSDATSSYTSSLHSTNSNETDISSLPSTLSSPAPIIIPPETAPPAEFYKYARHCIMAHRRIFFVTEQGFVGIAYPSSLGNGTDECESVAAKQCVVVPYGAAMPFILNVPDPFHREMQGRIVAPAFVSCLMQDQIEKAPLSERVFLIS